MSEEVVVFLRWLRHCLPLLTAVRAGLLQAAPCSRSPAEVLQGLWEKGVFKKWSRKDLLNNDRVFTSRYVYKLKRSATKGEVYNFEARLIVRGFRMEKGVDDDVFYLFLQKQKMMIHSLQGRASQLAGSCSR